MRPLAKILTVVVTSLALLAPMAVQAAPYHHGKHGRKVCRYDHHQHRTVCRRVRY
ncbi:MAG: hypothetical protein LBV61_02810 [Burkholderiaceae bacterium]|jgi:hypothetical protein|nr:hypothetical protein [Burkholderiaceae bacterium]